MVKVFKYKYKVAEGEAVEVDIERVKVNTPPKAALDGTELVPEQLADRMRVTFSVSQEPGNTHFLKFWFEFPPQTDDDAFFKLTTRGDAGGGDFDLGKVMEPGNADEFNFDTMSIRYEVA